MDGAVRMWNWLREYELDIDQAVLDKFDRFFIENDPIGLMTKSIPAQLREEDEYIPQWPDTINDNLMRVGDHGIEPEAWNSGLLATGWLGLTWDQTCRFIFLIGRVVAINSGHDADYSVEMSTYDNDLFAEW